MVGIRRLGLAFVEDLGNGEIGLGIKGSQI